ncbi:EAL domain-containing protein [Nitrosomonas sp.]|uniref:sensor domain-containing phosphodiesterase n=1 Tax=Nitrosomonas sp. TaxID=42353 RepID=UPI001D77B48B|nr:EAL domain-containing protein [Nitrosomonas sp.]MBX3615590.1 EAL domain-containing protein [Nitrosomonas sp.]
MGARDIKDGRRRIGTTDSETKHVEQLKKLYELSMTLSSNPTDIFKHIARMIAELFDVRVVCLSEIRGDQLYFIAVYVDGNVFLDAGQCPLAITPCATVELSKDIRVYDRVSELFPEASFLQEHNALAYCGFPVLDNHQNVIAITCLLDDKPHEFTDEDQELLRIFGQRISMELERQRHINEHLKSEENLHQMQAMMFQTEQLAGIGSWEWNIPEGIIHWSPEMYRLHQIDPVTHPTLTPEMAISKIDPADLEQVQTNITQALVHGVWEPIEYRLRLKNDQVRLVKAEGLAVQFKQSFPTKLIGFVQDVSELKITQLDLERNVELLRRAEQLQREQQRMSALLSAMNIGVLFEDQAGRIEFVNPAFKYLWEISDTFDLTGFPARDILTHSSHRLPCPERASQHAMQMSNSEPSERFEIELHDGRILTQLSYPVTNYDGAILGRLWIYEDITQERQTAKQLLYLAERDSLTGLLNRHRFQEQLEQYWRMAKRHHIKFALLYFDLDEFKYVNDTFGYRVGDTVLVRIAGEIASLVQSSELFARLGGDEFAIVIEHKQDAEPSMLAAYIVNAVSSVPFRFRGANIRLTTSVGIAIFPDHGLEIEDLGAHADAAMYQAKSMGKNNWCIYDVDRDMSAVMTTRMTWKSRIAQALEQNYFEIHFQGVYVTRNRALKHVEALVRMRDLQQPDQLIMPGQFIPVAEKSGQILDIDKWVLQRSIEVLAKHAQMPPIAVNISGRSFDDPSLPRFIQTQLNKHQVDPGRLIIELTETSAVSDIQDAQRFIEAINQAGCKVCLDDFGSGFSTFSYLKYLGVEILKIDGMFIRDLVNNRDNQIFVKAMVDVARGLGKDVVAEFVEDAMTLEMIQNLGIQFVQGYYLGRPSPEIIQSKSCDAG